MGKSAARSKKHTPEILMCPPTYFSIEYQINPWMAGHVDRNKACRQWKNLKRAFEKLGMRVSLIEPVKYLPDMVFTADQGAVYDHIFIKSNFRHKERRRESLYTLHWFKKKGFSIVELPASAYFEGRGDLLFFNGSPLIGVGFRSNRRAARVIGRLLHQEPVILRLTDSYFYHLDTALCVLPGKALMVYEEAFDAASRKKIHSLTSDIISIGKEDARNMACNAAVFKNSIVMSKGCSKILREKLRRKGLTIIEVDLSEFLKAGGGAHCLSWDSESI